MMDNTTKQPLLTICIPTYERAEMLDKCLEALFDIQKNDHDFCLIVCDNGSKDNTKEIIAKWKPQFRYMETLFHDTNKGADRNMFSLYMAVKTDYCWLLGDCDTISLEHFAMIEDLLYKGYDAIVINADSKRLKIGSKLYTDLENFLDEQLWHVTKLSSFILTRKALIPDHIKRYFDSHFVHVGTFVEYLCLAKTFNVYYDRDIQLILGGDEKAKERIKGGWRQIPFYVWGRCYSTMIMSFPFSIPYELKQKLMRDHERQYHWFSLRELLVNKIYRGKEYVDDYKRNRKYIHMVTVASKFLSDFIMYMPIEPFYMFIRFTRIVYIMMFIKQKIKVIIHK